MPFGGAAEFDMFGRIIFPKATVIILRFLNETLVTLGNE
jgi:hypothetical protein